MRKFIVGIMLVAGAIAEDKATVAPVPVPDKFTSEIQALARQYGDLATAQKVLDLTRDNLQLRICGEIGIKPDVCRINWNTGMVLKMEPTEPAKIGDKPAATNKK